MLYLCTRIWENPDCGAFFVQRALGLRASRRLTFLLNLPNNRKTMEEQNNETVNVQQPEQLTGPVNNQAQTVNDIVS